MADQARFAVGWGGPWRPGLPGRRGRPGGPGGVGGGDRCGRRGNPDKPGGPELPGPDSCRQCRTEDECEENPNQDCSGRAYQEDNCDCKRVPPPCDYPMVDATLSWTDADETKSAFGKTFTNGETKALCPLDYYCSIARFGSSESWRSDYMTLIGTEWTYFPYWPPYYTPSTQYWYQRAHLTAAYDPAFSLDYYQQRVCGYSTYAYSYTYTKSYNLSTWSVGGAPGFPVDCFGQLTTTDGVTVEWARGRGAWGVC